MSNKVEVTVVLENHATENKRLVAEHGLSVFIEHPDAVILFDTGQGMNTLKNLRFLGKDLEKVDHLILSHNHYDHAGGVKCLLKHGLRCPVFVGQGFFDEKYRCQGDSYTYLGSGLTEEVFEKYHIETHVVSDTRKLADSIYVMGNFSKPSQDVPGPGDFAVKRNREFFVDTFSDEISLVIKAKQGLIVFVGCSHPKLLNMLNKISHDLSTPIYAVIGGAHFAGMEDDELISTLKELSGLHVRKMFLNHCSGDRCYALAGEADIELFNLHVGDTVVFDV